MPLFYSYSCVKKQKVALLEEKCDEKRVKEILKGAFCSSNMLLYTLKIAIL